MSWSWTILGQPIGKGVARVFHDKNTGDIRSANRPKTAEWMKNAVENIACRWDGGPLDEPVRIEIVAVFARPKYMLAKKYSTGRITHASKPDWDNIAKIVGDSMVKAGVLRDDALITGGAVDKYYAAIDEGPRVEVTMRKMLAGAQEAVSALERLGYGKRSRNSGAWPTGEATCVV